MAVVETRKVQLTGGTTLTVSLPKAWADRVGLRTGDRIAFHAVEGNALQLRPVGELEQRAPVRERIDASGLTPRMLEQRVIGLYVAGCDIIDVVGLTPAALEAVGTLPRRLSGLEAVRQGPDWITLQDFMDARNFDVAAAFDRMYATASGIHRAALAAIAKMTPPPLAEARARNEEVERLQWVAVRQQRRLADDASRSRLPAHAALTYAKASVFLQTFSLYGLRLSEATQVIACSAAGRTACTAVLDAGAQAIEIADEAARALRKVDLQAADNALRRLSTFEERFAATRSLVAHEAAKGGACGLCLSAAGVLEWVNSTALAGGRLADLAIQHAVDVARVSLPGPELGA